MPRYHHYLVPLLLAAAFWVLGPSPLLACQICIPFPKKSAADFLIEAETVVLAREDPERPFHFAPVEILKGDYGEKKIDLFLDSSTRRILSTYPDRSVVLVMQPEKGKPIWKRIAVADREVGPLVREVLKLADDWNTTPGNRIDFFASHLGHENPQIRALAHLEIARAPYSEIRRLGNVIPREEIHRFLGNVRYLEWHALYILLLAQSGDPSDREFIEESFDSAAKFGIKTRLAAWATAMIELNEAAAVATIGDRYFRNPNREPDELKAVIQALSVHGTNGQVHLRDQIVASYGTLLENHPETAPLIIGNLMAWRNDELKPEISRIAADDSLGFDFKTMLQLRRFSRDIEGGKSKIEGRK